MAASTKPLKLPVGVFLILRDLIRERIGFSFEDDKRDLLAVKLADRVRALGLPTFLDYYYLLKYGPDAEAEWPQLTDALSVQETFFWREFEPLQALVDILIPRQLALEPGPLRIWSAACATGEEPLSIAMALTEAGWFERTTIEIWASDVSSTALAKARAGVYRERSFRALPPVLRDRYFTSEAGAVGFVIKPLVSETVRAAVANALATPGDVM